MLNTILTFDHEERIKSINSIEIKATSRFCNLFDADTQFSIGGTPIMFAVAGCGIDGVYAVELNRLNFSVIKPLQGGWITSLFVDPKTQRVYITSNDGTLSIIDIDPVHPDEADPTVYGSGAKAGTGAAGSRPGAVNAGTGQPGQTQPGQTGKPATNPQPAPTGPAKGGQTAPTQPNPSQQTPAQPGPTKPAAPATSNPAQPPKQPAAVPENNPQDF